MHEGVSHLGPSFTLSSINWDLSAYAVPPRLSTRGAKDMALWLDLLEAFAFLGLAGAVLAVGAALTAAFAFILLGSPTGGGMAAACWLICLTLSVCSGLVVGNWVLPAVAAAALPLSLLFARALRLVRAPQPTLSQRSALRE